MGQVIYHIFPIQEYEMVLNTINEDLEFFTSYLRHKDCDFDYREYFENKYLILKEGYENSLNRYFLRLLRDLEDESLRGGLVFTKDSLKFLILNYPDKMILWHALELTERKFDALPEIS